MLREGDVFNSEDYISKISLTDASYKIKQAPATLRAFNYDGVHQVTLPLASDCAGEFVSCGVEIATPTNTLLINAASGDRILSGSTVVSQLTLDSYGEEVLLFSDGLFWYTC